METPWGTSQGKGEVLAEGIVSYSTASHGGIRLSPERQAQLPKGIDNFLHSMQWWEEDCDWSVPYVFFRQDIKAHGTAYKFEENLATAQEIAKRYHPEMFVKV